MDTLRAGVPSRLDSRLETRVSRSMTELQNAPTTTGLAPNLAGALAYLFAPLTGILFFVIEKENSFVRFHAAQSTIFGLGCIVAGVALAILGMILGMLPLIGWLISSLISLAMGLGFFALWLFLIFQAFQGREWEVPVVGEQARRLMAPAVS
jgi:uncharacterized membrane protein